MYTIVVSYTRNYHLYEIVWETSGHRSNYPPQPFHRLTPQGENISCKRCPESLLSSEKGKTPKHLPLHQPRGLASPPLPETPTGRVWTRYTAPTGGSKLFRKKTVTSSLCAITTNSTIPHLTLSLLKANRDFPHNCQLCLQDVGGSPSVGKATDEKDARGYTGEFLPTTQQ